MAEQINPHLFRGYSIRGVAERDLPTTVVVRIAEAIGEYLSRRGLKAVLVGRDVRLSSARISRELVEGLLHTGIRVADASLIPTPVHNFAVDYYGFDAGIMVTASHNPSDYNGLKIRTSQTLTSEDVTEIYHLACASEFSQSPADRQPMPASGLGSYVQLDPQPDYERLVTAGIKFGRSRSLSLVIDGGYGANGLLVPSLLRRLGLKVWEINCTPDGHFPHRSPDPTSPGATDMLAAEVLARQAHFGLAYDGDGDRVVVVDEKGSRLPGDQLLMILARDVLQKGPGTIVYEVSCSQAVADDVIAHCGRPVITPTGYAFVHDAMTAAGAVLGGEMSGHFFFASPVFRFDDAILATLRLISILSQTPQFLSSLVASLPTYFSSPVLRIDCPDAIKRQVVEEITAFFSRSWPVDRLDGARIDFGYGWALVRESNTQPVLSLRFESKTEAGLATITEVVMQQIDAIVDKLKPGQSVRSTVEQERSTQLSRHHNLGVVILAAGQGTRMQSDLPKVLHPLLGRPMIAYVLEAVETLHPSQRVVVVGYRGEMVRSEVGHIAKFAEQQRRLGTGHAVLQAREATSGCDTILVLYGDMPLIQAATLQRLWRQHARGSAPITMLVVKSSQSRGFGRIIRDQLERVAAIVEEADCTPQQLAINELNPGVYCFDAGWLWEHLQQLPLHPEKGGDGEYFLTDLIAMAVAEGHTIADIVSEDPLEALGVNTPDHLLQAEEGLRRRLNKTSQEGVK